MTTAHVGGLPGPKSQRDYTPRIVRKSVTGVRYIPGGKIIDGSLSRDILHTGNLDVLRPGLLMGKITATGLYAPSIIGTLQSAYTGVGTSVTSMTVTPATAVEINRRIGATGTFKLTGPPTAAGTVATTTITYSAVNTTTGVLTITDPNVNAIAGSFIQPTDGSEELIALIDDDVFIKVTDDDAADIDVPFAKPLVGGDLDSSQIIHWPSDTSLRQWIVDNLSDNGALFTFDHLV